jgi:hypothetical protein
MRRCSRADTRPLGSITPRVWTRPLRKLTPRTSYGYAVIHFAAVVLQRPLDPWQQWLVIHAGEMLDDGRPRFKQVLVIVGRQNGKTHLCTVLALFWLYAERWPLVFGTSNKLDYAKDSWENAKDWALETPALAGRTRRPRVGNGAQDLPTADRCHYRIGAANEDGGRSKSIDRAIGDELRQQRDWSAYLAMMPALNARPKGQVVFITNMGDDRSVVLNSLRADALDSIADGQVARPVGLFEWSAPPGSHPMDVAGWAAANPQLGRRNDYDDIYRRAKGGRQAWPPRGVTVTELAAGTAPAVCMAFAANVLGRLVVHSGQALLDRQQEQAEKMWTGDRWVFTRSGAGHVDALYAAAGADHLVRTMPAPKVYAKRGHYGG